MLGTALGKGSSRLWPSVLGEADRDVKPRAMLSDGRGARDSTSSRLAEETSILQQLGPLGLSQANMRPTRS